MASVAHLLGFRSMIFSHLRADRLMKCSNEMSSGALSFLNLPNPMVVHHIFPQAAVVPLAFLSPLPAGDIRL